MAFGSFDLLHPGHVAFLQAARRLGNRLVVAVARDSSIKKIKGRRPLFSERERLRHLRQLRVVDEAVLGGKRDFYAIVRRVKPDVIALGYDQAADAAKLDRLARVVRLKAFKPERFKSSILKKGLKKHG